jgi:2-iminobutanoate/2-iminopropanoate deaminase
MLAMTVDSSAEACSGSLFRRRGRAADFTAGTYTPPLWIGKRTRRTLTLAIMPHEIISTLAAPKAIGPYSQAVAVPAGVLVFCSGQIPIDPQTGELAGAGDVRQEVHQVMKNLDVVLRAAGSSLERVVKTTIYLVNLGNFSTVNEVYATYFKDRPPARATVQVTALPRGAQVEIDAIATAS